MRPTSGVVDVLSVQGQAHCARRHGNHSVLTRLPAGRRIGPDAVMVYLQGSFHFPPVTLRSEAYEDLLGRLGARAVQGGAVLDALVGATALQEGATLLTLDGRAAATYEAVGVPYGLV